jgi:cytochrome c oxidase assembly protein Cox11
MKVNKVMSKQRGMSITSWVFVIAVTLFFTLLGIKMVPTYMEFYSISGILESIKEDRSLKNATPRHVRKIFDRRIDINSIYDFDPKSLKFSVGKGESKGKTVMEVEYEVRKKMAGNVDVVMSFYKKVVK